MNNYSETNWDKVDALTDEAMDRSELPPLDDSFFKRATWRMLEKPAVVTVPVDPDLCWPGSRHRVAKVRSVSLRPSVFMPRRTRNQLPDRKQRPFNLISTPEMVERMAVTHDPQIAPGTGHPRRGVGPYSAKQVA